MASTGLSLNERFTAIGKPVEPVVRERRGRSRSRSRARSGPRMDRATSVANQNLLKELVRKHTMRRTALKLKRKSLRTAGAGNAIGRRSIKTLRVAPNGRPIRANSMTRVATMKADFVASARRRPLRRASSNSRINSRVGVRRPLVGGAAERVARRQTDRLRSAPIGTPRRGRSRSRSRARLPPTMATNNRRGRSVSRVGDNRRSRSRSRLPVLNARNPRDTVNPRNARNTRSVPIKARLGVRRGDGTLAENGRKLNRGGNRKRAASVGRRGVAAGRIQKRRNSNIRGSGGNVRNGGEAVSQMGRANGRSTIRNQGRRSRSRTRRNSGGRVQQPQQQRSGGANGGRRPGRSQQRPVPKGRGAPQRKGKINSTRKGQQQQTRGRSRSRGGRNNPTNTGKNAKTNVNKDELDKELDQYMATTKTENGINYLY